MFHLFKGLSTKAKSARRARRRRIARWSSDEDDDDDGILPLPHPTWSATSHLLLRCSIPALGIGGPKQLFSPPIPSIYSNPVQSVPPSCFWMGIGVGTNSHSILSTTINTLLGLHTSQSTTHGSDSLSITSIMNICGRTDSVVVIRDQQSPALSRSSRTLEGSLGTS